MLSGSAKENSLKLLILIQWISSMNIQEIPCDIKIYSLYILRKKQQIAQVCISFEKIYFPKIFKIKN
jgi:hypothetical protein